MSQKNHEKHDHIIAILGEDRIENWNYYYPTDRVTASTLLKRIRDKKIIVDVKETCCIAKAAKNNKVSRMTVNRKWKSHFKNKGLETLLIIIKSALLCLDFV